MVTRNYIPPRAGRLGKTSVFALHRYFFSLDNCLPFSKSIPFLLKVDFNCRVILTCVWIKIYSCYFWSVIKVAKHSFLAPMCYSSLFSNHWQLGSQNWQDTSSAKRDYILICFIELGTVTMSTQLVVNQH